MIMNEKIKASEVQLTGIDGEDLGVVSTAEALAMAKKLKVDLVCTSMMSSPPPCKLIGAAAAKQEKQQTKKSEKPMKSKELRLTPHIEQHDYDTKMQQAERILRGGDAVQVVVLVTGKQAEQGKKLVEELLSDLKQVGKRETGIQVSGKKVEVRIVPN